MKHEASPETVRSIKSNLSYCPKTGHFTWLTRPAFCVQPGDRAGCVNSSGYRQIRLGKQIYKEHRLAFLFMLGRWPMVYVDHVNRIRDDNRWSNLKEATPHENNLNRSVMSNNKTGISGVCFNQKMGKYLAYITRKRKTIYLGAFCNLDDAIAARINAEVSLAE